LKNRVLSLLLLFCLLAPLAATLFIVEEHRAHVKKEIKKKFIAAVGYQKLTKLAVSKQNEDRLKWHEEKEFEYLGEMYDVVKSETSGDTTYYWCWWDHEETDLNNKLEELVADALGNSTQQKENSTLLLKLLDVLYCTESAPAKPELTNITQDTIPVYQNSYQSPSVSHPFPPPELV
jgi:hypothetical protein